MDRGICLTAGAIILCRLDSKRLPGKALRVVRGKPLLWYTITRCRQIKRFSENIVVATSDRVIDDPIADYCEKENVQVFRGSIENVAKRILDCALVNKLDYFARINGDSPFLEPALIDLAFEIAISEGYEIVTNLYPRSFPYGVSVELLYTESFQRAYRLMKLEEHFEHVTLFLYQNMHLFRYYNILRNGDNLSDFHLTVDTEEDLKSFTRILDYIGGNWGSFGYVEAVELCRSVLN